MCKMHSCICVYLTENQRFEGPDRTSESSSVRDKFKLRTEGWHDHDLPLSYQHGSMVYQ